MSQRSDNKKVLLFITYWRMYERAIDRLEKFQRKRPGQSVPEINVGVTKE